MIKYIAVHHTGGTVADPLASTSHLSAESVEQYHKDKWNFRSSLGRYGGYNFFIDASGQVTQFRAVGEETAAQYGHNFDTISICLAGNFSAGGNDTPSKFQEKALVELIGNLFEFQESGHNDAGIFYENIDLDLSDMRIVPHRLLSQTTCYGDKLPDSYARDLYLASKDVGGLYKIILDLCFQIINLIQLKTGIKAAGFDRDCDGIINIKKENEQ